MFLKKRTIFTEIFTIIQHNSVIKVKLGIILLYRLGSPLLLLLTINRVPECAHWCNKRALMTSSHAPTVIKKKKQIKFIALCPIISLVFFTSIISTSFWVFVVYHAWRISVYARIDQVHYTQTIG